jgi:hypothetical protein
VIVDGRKKGQTPQTIKIEAGRRHKVVLVGPEDRKKTFDVKVKKGETKRLFESFPTN